jgi:hypothetical protein
VKKWFNESSIYERALCYLKYCPDEEYDQLIERVNDFWFNFAAREEKAALEDLKEKIRKAEKRTTTQRKNEWEDARKVEGRKE